MSDFAETASAFVEIAHRIVWCTAASVSPDGRPRTRILHPYWMWEDDQLVGWIATGPSPVKRADLEHSPYLSCTYWATNQDTCTADSAATWFFDDETRQRVWDMFKDAPAPVGYDPGIIPPWKDGPLSPSFAPLRLEPYRLRVFPGTALLSGTGTIHTWKA